jgi:hypothetical protein
LKFIGGFLKWFLSIYLSSQIFRICIGVVNPCLIVVGRVGFVLNLATLI